MEQTTTRTLDMTAAARQHHLLNPRQQETLRLLAEGKTNPEIAAALGMTLDGAKWNVSEILSKLGFSSREEAAEYYRWRQHPSSRVRRWARGLLSLPGGRWLVGGGSTAIAVGAILAGVAMARDDSDPSAAAPSTPFVLEATISVVDRSREINTVRETDPTTGEDTFVSPDGGGNTAPTISNLQWSYESNERFRYRIGRLEGDMEVVADGNDLWSYNGQVDTYQRGPLAVDWPASMVIYPTLSFTVGPVPGGSIEKMMEWFGYGSDPNFSYERVDSTSMLGRTVTVFEFRPASRSSDGVVEEGDGYGRVFVDEDDGVVLRFLIETGDTSLDMVVTSFERVDEHEPDVFKFVPPAGAVEAPPSDSAMEIIASGVYTSSSSSGTGGAPDGTPRGFLSAGSVPDGFRNVFEETEESGATVTRRVVEFRTDASDDQRVIRLEETLRRSSLQGDETFGEIIQLRGTQVFVKEAGSAVRLTWAERGRVVVLTGSDVSREDLLKVVEGLAVQP